jgi:toxin ParE1/3/4
VAGELGDSQRASAATVTIFWTSKALSDLRGLRLYIAQDAPGNAAVIVARIRTTAQSLEPFPYRGRPGGRRNTRELIVPRTPYIIVYRVIGETVQILRIFHGAQRWPAP